MKRWLRRLVLASIVLTATILGILEALRWTATRQGVVSVPLPEGSEIAKRALESDYADAYRIPLDRPDISGDTIASLTFQPGREIARTDNEVVFAGGAPGLRFLASYVLEPDEDAVQLTMSTAVFYESALGRLYFLPVGIGHRRLVPFALSRMAQDLDSVSPPR